MPYRAAVSKRFLQSVGATSDDRPPRRPSGRGNITVRNRRNYLLGVNPRCFYCGTILEAGTATLDHAIPKSKGGTIRDTVLACRDCNQKKKDKVFVVREEA